MNDYQKIKTDLKAHIVHTEPVWKRMIKCLRKMMAPQYRTPQTMLSVIVPVYNTGPYLEECLKSIVNNGNLPVTEIICVNDGSTDGSSSPSSASAAEDCLPPEIPVLNTQTASMFTLSTATT